MTSNNIFPIGIVESSLESLRLICREEKRNLYAILDACDEPRVPEKAELVGNERIASLYRGAAQRDYWAFAPYLAVVDETLLDWIAENLWEDNWGIFAVSDVDFPSMRKHFRKFLMVEMPDGEEMYFRYYDPRVLKTFLESATTEELSGFFGPIETFIASELNSDDLMQPFEYSIRQPTALTERGQSLV